MTIPNRTVSITGVFAADASTTIPQNPVPGASYRDTTMTGTIIREGWPFKTIVDSSKFNQAMYEYTSVTSQVEKYGFLPWSNQTDYELGSLCLGSDGKIYQAKQATGPSTTAYDPTTNSSVWNRIIWGVTEFLFHHVWSEYVLNKMDWLRADTFSWQDGTVYTEAYNHLVADYNGGTSQTETVGSYTITYVLATDGHKIATDETTVLNIYNESGVAWYYILDTANQRFKLPRENPAREELIQVVRAKGNGKTLGINLSATGQGIAGQLGGASGGSGYANAIVTNTTTNPNLPFGVSTDPTKSGIISSMTDSTSVYKGKQYLYFYVGQFSQTATEQTAGITSEQLNQKVDISSLVLCPVVIDSYESGSSWYRIYSDGWVIQGEHRDDWGGTGTFNFLVPLRDTNYCIVFNGRGANSTSNLGIDSSTPLGITYDNSVNTLSGDVVIYGYKGQ